MARLAMKMSNSGISFADMEFNGVGDVDEFLDEEIADEFKKRGGSSLFCPSFTSLRLLSVMANVILNATLIRRKLGMRMHIKMPI